MRVYGESWFGLTQESLQAGKATTVQLIMEKMPTESIDFLVAHVSCYGWQRSMISDDSMATKKLLRASLALQTAGHKHV